ncbi:DUF2313 domain-containing protein [Aquincola tertiaricarbonis]|uniref:DUF2313 domain-containing protein n=1 Tax=Aquincola tertiaricarbonis TaxID=391953 RepID=A0ABY4SF00_AQUTE|nr:putative phage tail protein [Aquincola tertiaricarbonis]URI11049.1 DUF2313 domain-containing protein [Aquincola tertiaricarbonis]
MSSADRFSQALQHLLPQGYAWPRDPSSVLMRLLRGMAASFAELHDYTAHTAGEWLPHATRTRLEEWEAATGLPDPCFGPLQTYADRQARLVAKLRGPTGAYDDSSPAAPGAIEAFCQSMGFDAEVRYNTPFRAGRDRVGRRLGQLDGRLYVLVPVADIPFRVGRQRVGARLVQRPPGLAEMACSLEKIVPARYALNIVFTTP